MVYVDLFLKGFEGYNQLLLNHMVVGLPQLYFWSTVLQSENRLGPGKAYAFLLARFLEAIETLT